MTTASSDRERQDPQEEVFRIFGRDFPVWFVSKFLFSVLLSLQLCKVAKLIPLPSLFLDQPIVQNDYGRMYAQVLRDRELYRAGRHGWGYDPYHMAGYPAGCLLEFDSRPAIVVDRLLRCWPPAARTMRLTIFFSFLSAPIFLYFACLAFGFDKKTALVAMALGVAGFANFDVRSLDMLLWGWCFFLVGNYLAVFATSRFYRALYRPTVQRFLRFSVSLFLVLLFHPISFLIALVPIVLLYVLCGSRLTTRDHMFVALGFFFAVAGNLFWLGPLSRFIHYFAPEPFDRVGVVNFVRQYFPALFGSRPWDNTLLRAFVIFSFCAGLRILWASQRTLAYVFAGWVVTLVIFARFGGHLPIIFRTIANRYAVALMTVMVFPASVFMSQFFLKWRHTRLFFFLWILWFQMTWQIADAVSLTPLVSGIKDGKDTLIDRLRHLSTGGRILFETSNGSFPAKQLYSFFERLGKTPVPHESPERLSLLSDLLPFLTEREFIGTPIPNAPLLQYASTGFSFKDDNKPAMLFDKPLSHYNRNELVEALKRYNVTHVVAFSLQARSKFDRYPDVFKPVRYDPEGIHYKKGRPILPPEVSPYRIYKVLNYDPTYFLKGSGHVQADYDRATIDNPSRGEILLKYHWLDTLHAPEDVKIVPKLIGDDPNPFILLINDSDLKKITLQDMFR